MKRVLITGASSGIGYATALTLHKRGYSVLGIARDFSGVDHDFMQIEQINLANADTLPAALKTIEFEPDCLVLNAGRGLFGGLEQLSNQQIRQVVDLNLISNFILLKHFLPDFKKQRDKDIVLIGSEAALQGAKQGAVYCATKFALRGLAQSLRADCAAAGIRVMLVNPGPTATHFFDDLHFKPKAGEDYSIAPEDIATSLAQALELPRNVVQEEILLQPIKRAFTSKTE